jgi:hypothetical protein
MWSLFESVGDLGQAVAGCVFACDPVDRVGGHGRWPAEPDAVGAFERQRLPDALRDRPSFAGGEAGQQGRLRLPSGPGRLGRAVEGDQRPPLLLSGRDQRAQVGHEAGEPAAVRGYQPLPVIGLEQPQRRLDAGTLQLLGRQANLLNDPDQPATPRTRRRNRPPLGLEALPPRLFSPDQPEHPHSQNTVPTRHDPSPASRTGFTWQPSYSKHSML